MLSILDVHPKITGTPKEPLRRATEELTKVAETVTLQDEEARRVRNRYISKVLPHAGPPPVAGLGLGLGEFKLAITTKIISTYGRKGPTENALSELDLFATRAQRASYPLHSPQLQTAFVNFLMIYVTEGFTGKDTTGTQMAISEENGAVAGSAIEGGSRLFKALRRRPLATRRCAGWQGACQPLRLPFSG